jgi:hypothetical protein
MTNVIKMLPKTLRLFTISFNQANAVYVKIYETALNHKANIGRYLYRVCRVVFSIKSNSLSFITREIFCTLGAQKKVAEQLSSTLLNSH